MKRKILDGDDPENNWKKNWEQVIPKNNTQLKLKLLRTGRYVVTEEYTMYKQSSKAVYEVKIKNEAGEEKTELAIKPGSYYTIWTLVDLDTGVKYYPKQTYQAILNTVYKKVKEGCFIYNITIDGKKMEAVTAQAYNSTDKSYLDSLKSQGNTNPPNKCSIEYIMNSDSTESINLLSFWNSNNNNPTGSKDSEKEKNEENPGISNFT